MREENVKRLEAAREQVKLVREEEKRDYRLDCTLMGLDMLIDEETKDDS